MPSYVYILQRNDITLAFSSLSKVHTYLITKKPKFNSIFTPSDFLHLSFPNLYTRVKENGFASIYNQDDLNESLTISIREIL